MVSDTMGKCQNEAKVTILSGDCLIKNNSPLCIAHALEIRNLARNMNYNIRFKLLKEENVSCSQSDQQEADSKLRKAIENCCFVKQ